MRSNTLSASKLPFLSVGSQPGTDFETLEGGSAAIAEGRAKLANVDYQVNSGTS